MEIKGVTIPALLIKLDKNKSFEENLKELEDKLDSAFFKDSLVVLDYENINHLDNNQIKQIEDVLKKYNSKVLGYKTKKEKKEDNIEKLKAHIPEVQEKKALKIVNKTLRSGQRVEYDGDILVLGDVNPDAYVIASGNIIVLGALRGIAHAGANGDESAIILALKLMPQQLRIASFITRSPDNVEEPEGPEKAYIEDNQIYIESIR